MQAPLGKKLDPVTSFRKKGADSRRIPGTRVSYHNAQLLTSVGVSSLDFHLGGGLPVGTVLLVEEDIYGNYSNLLLKYFVAEGVTNDHTVLLAGGDVAPEKLLNEVPAIAPIVQKVHPPVSDEQLKIAWRYKGQKSAPENLASFGHTYDLSKSIPPEQMKNANVITWNVSDLLSETNIATFVPEPYSSLLQRIRHVIDEQRFRTSEKNCNSLFRIAIGSMGSPLWERHGQPLDELVIIPRFLYILRSLLRSSYSVAFITLKATLLNNHKLISKICQMSDFVIQLESFVGDKKSQNAMLKDYDGLLQIVKLPCLNTFAYQIPTSDLAFKLKRKNLLIERLHLPPDIEEPSGDNVSTACGGHSKLLDF